jgi:hypothetical protein
MGMDVDGLVKNFDTIRTRPKESAIAFAIIVLAALAMWLVPKYFEPFRGLAGLYEGEAEGNGFYFCIKVYADEIKAQMTWPESIAPDRDYVEYSGEIKENKVALTWSRNPSDPRPDSGIAVITPRKNGMFGGYWQSSTAPNNRQTWQLRKVGPDCELLKWQG